MTTLDVSYPVWKQIALSSSLPTAHQLTQRYNRLYVWAGSVEPLYKSLVEGDDYTDWSSIFLAASTLVDGEDEAIAHLADFEAVTTSTQLPTDESGRRVVLVHDTSTYRLLEEMRDILSSINERLRRIESE